VSATKVEVLKPREEFDRLLARLEQQRIWQHTPEAVDLDITIVRSAIAMANEEKCPRSIKLRAWALAHRIVKETFVDRTIPAVSRVDHRHLIDRLPMSKEDIAAESVQTKEQREIAAARALLAGKYGPPAEGNGLAH